MRAVVATAYGEPDVCELAQVDEPEPDEGQVVVAVRYAAVNLADIVLLRNEYQVPAALPFVPGSEFAGEVVAAGPGVDIPTVGDLVYGSVRTGAFAERVAVDARSLQVVPAGFDLRHAAAFGVAYATAWYSLHDVGRLGEGQTVAIAGAAGGVGTAAVDLAVLLGARVIALASTPDKRRFCLDRGAAAALDPADDDLRARLRELGGLDVVLDPVGGTTAEVLVRSLRYGGRFVTVGFASGHIPAIPLNLVLLKGVEITGMEFASFALNRTAEAVAGRAQLHDWLVDGVLVPHVSAEYDLDDAVEAMSALAGRRSTGKVLLAV